MEKPKQDLSAIIGPRFLMLRKHLSERLGEDLTTEDIALKSGLKKHQVYRLEQNMSGTTDSLVALLLFYRSQGYNLDWIINTEEKRIPMMITTGKDLLAIVQQIGDLSKVLQENYERLSGRLSEMGYQPLENNLLLEEPPVTMPAAL